MKSETAKTKIKSRKNNNITTYLFALPALLFFSFSVALPFFLGIDIAFTNWDGLSQEYDYVGFKNFVDIFSDKNLITPIKNTILHGVVGCVIGNFVSLSLALFINQKLYVNKFSKVLFFLPTCLGVTLTAFVWTYIYRDVFNTLFNVNSPLGSIDWVVLAIIVMNVWNSSGVPMLIYYSALKSVPQELYESALIDGSNMVQRFWYITIPMIMPAITTNITMSLTLGMKEFGTTMTATNGGPAGASHTLGTYIYRLLFTYSDAGYGQAVALMLTFFLTVLGYFVLSIFKKKEQEL